jgi:hypothetical protein
MTYYVIQINVAVLLAIHAIALFYVPFFPVEYGRVYGWLTQQSEPSRKLVSTNPYLICNVQLNPNLRLFLNKFERTEL